MHVAAFRPNDVPRSLPEIAIPGRGAKVRKCARLHRFDEVESTNDVALEMARRGEPEATVVTARTQVPPPPRQGPQAALTFPWPTMTMSVPSVPRPGAEGRLRLEAPKFAIPTAIAVDHPAPSFGLPETGIRFPNL